MRQRRRAGGSNNSVLCGAPQLWSQPANLDRTARPRLVSTVERVPPQGGLKREHGAGLKAQDRDCPRNCNRRAELHDATGPKVERPGHGKAEQGDDTEVRRPAFSSHPCPDTGCVQARPSVAVTSRSAASGFRSGACSGLSVMSVFACGEASSGVRVTRGAGTNAEHSCSGHADRGP